jgi:hypothetical protein
MMLCESFWSEEGRKWFLSGMVEEEEGEGPDDAKSEGCRAVVESVVKGVKMREEDEELDSVREEDEVEVVERDVKDDGGKARIGADVSSGSDAREVRGGVGESGETVMTVFSSVFRAGK